MKTFLILLIFLIVSITINYLRKSPLKKGSFKFDKKNLYNWMNLTKNQRFDLSKRESKLYFNKRKILLNQIRNEYKNIPKKK